MTYSSFTWTAVCRAEATFFVLVKPSHVGSRRTGRALCTRALVRTCENGNRRKPG